MSPEATAAWHFRMGNLHYREQRWQEAQTAYRAAWAIERSYEVAGNLGEVELRLGRPREAATLLTYSLVHAPSSTSPDKLERTRLFLDSARKQVGVLYVGVNVPGARVLLDGRPLTDDELAGPLYVEPGDRMLEAQLAGHRPAHRIVEARAGSTQEVRLHLQRAAPQQTATRPLRSEPSQPLVVAGGLLAGTALAGGVAFTIAANAASDDAALDEQQALYTNLAIAGYALAAGGAAATVTYVFWQRTHPREGLVNVAPLVPWKGAPGGLILRGAF
ncbi:hypothetical protein [Polyangium aurulentum]|uniref:hypothetical protein n=1 Tax=Polyangium aurulentum TaxID=2567896 RepID=UPI0010AE23A4|nr:hypothetical protein [Polyangium aurulentum]UQA60346.1 hypothetical protein E8A73_007695 [Polyangium aurulentum]